MEVLLTILACLGLSFVMSGLESAMLAYSPARLRHAAKEGRRRAGLLEKMLRKKETLLTSLLVTNASANLLGFALITAETVQAWGYWGYPAAFVLSVPVYLLWSESIPKALFKQEPLSILIVFTPVLVVVYVTIRPFVALLAWPGRWIGTRFLKASSDEPSSLEPGETRAEFRALAEILERKGTLTTREREMIDGVLDFQQVRVNEVMLPLSRITAVPQEMPAEAVITLSRETRIDQFPVMAANGDLVGIVDVMDLLRESATTNPVSEYRSELVRCDPSDPAIRVVRRLRRAGHRVGAVFNPRGRPLGLVSVQDMVGRLTLSRDRSG